jgi:PBP1b-binding outer membrane lipoprotein LpoB
MPAIRIMNKLVLPLLAGALLLSGCASHYVIKLSNGNEITSTTKPKLDGNVYHITDANGVDHMVPRGRVREIEPTSMAEEEKKPKSVPTASTPSTRHWYFLWLF